MKFREHPSSNERRSLMKFALSFTLVLVFVIAALAQSSSELSGYVRYGDNSPVRGAILSIGNLNVATDGNGYYKMSYLTPGVKSVRLTPPQKVTRPFRVVVNNSPTRQDFTVDW
jgi:fumarate reductase subunit C